MTDLVTPVYINDRRVGAFFRVRDNRLGFEYDENWRRDPAAYPISLSMPLAASGYADRGRANTVGNFLWGLLPDNERTLVRWARHFEIGRGGIRGPELRRHSGCHRRAFRPRTHGERGVAGASRGFVPGIIRASGE